jgi:hypothetical protein
VSRGKDDEWRRLPQRDFNRIKKQRNMLRCHQVSEDRQSLKSSAVLDKHLGDITEALVLIHFERETPEHRFEARRYLERWLRDEEQTTREALDYWYGVILRGGEEERLNGALHVWRSLGMEVVHSILRSMNRAVAERSVPLASSQ